MRLSRQLARVVGGLVRERYTRDATRSGAGRFTSKYMSTQVSSTGRDNVSTEFARSFDGGPIIGRVGVTLIKRYITGKVK